MVLNPVMEMARLGLVDCEQVGGILDSHPSGDTEKAGETL